MRILILAAGLFVTGCAVHPKPPCPDFIALSKHSSTTIQAYLEGVENSDSNGPYVETDYYSDTLDFSLIYYPRNGNKKRVELDSVTQDAATGFHNFVLFAFVYPMKDPVKMKDLHADNITYPLNVKAYYRRDTQWAYLSQDTVATLNELTEYQIRSMYSIMNM